MIETFVFRKLQDIPPELLDQLKTLCYKKGMGYMWGLLHQKSRRDHFVTVTARYGDAICWSLIDNVNEAHVWTHKQERGQGLAQLTLAHMLDAIPTYRRSKIQMSDKDFSYLLETSRFIQTQLQVA